MIDNSEELFNVLLRRNFRHLLKSNHSIFSHGHVLEACGWDASGNMTEELLNGLLDVKEVAKSNLEGEQEILNQQLLNSLLTHLIHSKKDFASHLTVKWVWELLVLLVNLQCRMELELRK